jgi:sulfur relay (sulfurtransferase) complex TusBCD TusD component (DsrE family)
MKIGIILETNEPEKAWNAVRFANTALSQDHEVKVFLMNAGVEAESITHERFNVQEQIHSFVEKNGVLLACGTCIKGRNQAESEVCPVSTMIDCLNMVEWADKVVTF